LTVNDTKYKKAQQSLTNSRDVSASCVKNNEVIVNITVYAIRNKDRALKSSHAP